MNRVQARKRATELVEQMTVEEMASQLRFDAPAIERLGIPAYNWWNEGLHGVARCGTATVFPQAIALGATFDPRLLQQIGDAVATEARAKYNVAVKQNDRDIYKGITIWSPNVNLFRDPRWGRGHETYGEDPYLISRMGVAYIKGLQGDGEYMKTAACAKHLAAHSGPEKLRHTFDAKVSKKDLWETYLPAFEACVKEGKVEAVMGAYNRTNGEPCCAHSYLMEDVLRELWKFEGHYVSDCWAVRDFHESHKVTASPEESVTLALEKGCDLNCGCTYQRIMDAYHAGMLPLKYIKQSAIRVFTARYLLGMFDKTAFDDIPYTKVECKEHIALADTAAQESVVLLKNNGILPIDKEKVKTIGVIGPNADSRAALIGNYHGTSSRYITVLEGIQDLVGEDVRVLYSQGSDLFRDRVEPLAQPDDRLSEARAVAENSDLVVLCLGLDESLEGEEGDAGNAYASGDKESLSLPASQQRLLEAVIETNVPFVLCVLAGSALDLQLASEHAAAILQVWYPGARGGRDVAKILFGEVSPSGKLPVTFYRDLEHIPAFTDYSMKGRTYRYLESEPLYPFGYGLTYADTQIVSAETGASFQSAQQEGIELAVTAENRSPIQAQDVIQVYLHVEGTQEEVLHPRLVAFERVSFHGSETQRITLHIPPEAFRVVDQDGNRILDGNSASLFVGFGQPDKRTFELTGKQAVKVQLR